MFGDKLKKMFNKEGEEQEGNNKRKIENLVVFLVILIITIVAINIIWNGDSNSNENPNNTSTKQLASDNVNMTNINSDIEKIDNTSNLKENLEEILAKIKGVGEVQVFINYSESNEIVPMYNENSKISNTEENDTSGGTRKIQETDVQKEIIYQEDNGEKTPITQKVVQPKVEGAIVTAKGASDAAVKTSIIQAVEAVTGLATHKIQVFEMN